MPDMATIEQAHDTAVYKNKITSMKRMRATNDRFHKEDSRTDKEKKEVEELMNKTGGLNQIFKNIIKRG